MGDEGADPAAFAWYTDFDARDMPVAEVSPVGDKTRMTYTKDGQLASETRPNGVDTAAAGDYTTTYTYNKAGQLETRSVPYRDGQYQPDGIPLGSLKVTYTRNEVGDPTTITDARGFSFQNRFLDTGQLKSTERPSWWDLDWSGGQPSPTPGKNFRRQPGSSAGEPNTAVPVGGPTLVERTRPEDGGGTKDGMSQPLGAFNGATDFGDVDAQALPSMLSPAAIAQPMRLDYDDELRLTSTTPARLESEDPAPFTIGYDADGRVNSRSWPLDSAGADNITDATISHRFSYDANGNLTGFVNGVGWKAGEQPDLAGPNTTRWTYDAFDRRTEELAPGSLSSGGDSLIEREVTKFGYDANGNVLAVETPRGVATTGNSSDFTFTYRYDSLDRLASEANALGDTWTYAYDAASNVVAETSPRGTATSTSGDFTTTTSFDRADRPVLIEEPEGRTTELEYDSNGNVVRATEPGAATELSEAMESDDLSAHVTTYAYDGRDLPWKETVGEGSYRRTTVTEYDPEGQLRRTVNPRGVDSNGNPLQADSQTDPWLAATHATVNTWSKNGLLVTSRMPRASQKPVGPSSAGALNDPYQDEVTANAEEWRQDFRYDKRGRLWYVSAPHEQADAPEVEDAAPSTGGSQSVPGQTYKFFDTGWIASSDDSQVIDPQQPHRTLQGQAIAYSYDANGNQTRWQSRAVGSRDEFERFDDRQITRSFYPSGLLKSRTGEIELGSSTPERSYKYFYNPDRSLVEIQDTLPQQLVSGTGLTQNRNTKIFRDDAEREVAVKEAWDTGRDTAFSYDRDGNLLTRKTDGSFTEGTGSYTGGKTTSFTYDDVGRELTMDVSGPGEDLSVDTDYYPSGVVAARTRQVGANDPVQEAYAYRTDGLVSRAMREGGDGNSKDQTYLYDPNGNRTQDERGEHFFNARDQLVFWHRDADQPAQGDTSVSYALNGAGSIEDKWDEAMPTGEERTQYFYEGERLVRTEAPKLRSYYFYDLFGNVTQIDSDSKEGGVFPSTPQGPNPDELCSNRATGGDGSGVTNYCYDEFERLVKTTTPGEEDPVRYIHDGLDRRDLKLVGAGSGTAREYSYIGTSELLAREEDSDSKRRTYDYGSDGLRVAQLSRDAQGQEEYHPFALDALGSVEALEEEDGSVEANSDYRYDPYGQIEVDPEDDSIKKPEDTLSEDAKANPFRFQGHYYDSGTQTYDMKAREYRPDVGRFLSADRFEQASKDLALQSDPLTQNRYAFAGGNPVSRIDWDGHFPGYNDQEGQLGKSPPPKALDTTPPPKAAPAPDALWNRKEALITEIKLNPENPLNDGLVQGDPYEMSLEKLQDIYATAEERCPGCREEPWQPSWGDLATAATFLPLPSSVAGKFCLKFCDDGGRLFGRVFGGGDEAGETVARSTVPAGRGGPLVKYDADFALRQAMSGGSTKASELADFAGPQGWRRSQTATGPIKFVDQSGIERLTIKSGSPRTPGSELPHVSIRDASGARVDRFGNPVSRRSPGNHTPIEWDLP